MDQPGISPLDLFAACEVPISGSVPWGSMVGSTAPGVYIVGLHRDPADGRGLASAPIDQAALHQWMVRVHQLRIGAAADAPSVELLAGHLARWWLPDTSVLYVGKATVLKQRVHQYLKTPIGAPGPHRGGQWLKTLSILPRLTVHYAELPAHWPRATDLEDNLLNTFVDRYGPVPARHPEPQLPLPWANLTVDRPRPQRRRQHQIHPNAL